jgi:quercetin dioxygenase-like cupin family protein
MRHRAQGFWAGFLVGVSVAVVLVAGPAVAGFGGMGRDSAKYTSKVVLENERVRVREVTFPAGVLDTGMHTHDLPHVGVILTKGAMLFTEPGGKSDKVDFEAGSVGFRDAHVTHQVGNPGPAPMRVIEVELK